VTDNILRAGILLCAIGFAFSTLAQGPSRDAEIELLKQRVRELEEQNITILKELQEVKARLNSQTAEAGASSAPMKPSAPSPPLSEAKASSPQQEPIRWGDLMSGTSRVKIYGFLRLDLIADDSRPDNSQIPFFILSEDARVGQKNAGTFTLHPRLTRLGLNYTGSSLERLGQARLSGQLEVDFQNGGRESRQIIRIRHANMKVSRGDFWLLGGQTWDVISPLFPTVNNDTLMWNAGNLGDRRPQLIASYEPRFEQGQLFVTGGIGLTGAIDARDMDNNGFRDGEESARPHFQLRIGMTHQGWVKDQRVSVGIWGHRGFERTSRPIAGRREFRSQSLGLDYTLPIVQRIGLRGEAWYGRNLSDVRGGIGQGINAATGAAIRSRGGWIEATIRAHPIFTIHPGFTVDDPRDEDIPAQGRIRNRALWIANRFALGGGFLIGADYLRWITDYKGLQRGADHRFNLFLQYSF
jgi:hypothetical protein